jgi:hypothetical protein
VVPVTTIKDKGKTPPRGLAAATVDRLCTPTPDAVPNVNIRCPAELGRQLRRLEDHEPGVLVIRRDLDVKGVLETNGQACPETPSERTVGAN